MKDFSKLIDADLLSLARQHFVNFSIGFKYSGSLLDKIYLECERRDPGIYQQAIDEALPIIEKFEQWKFELSHAVKYDLAIHEPEQVYLKSKKIDKGTTEFDDIKDYKLFNEIIHKHCIPFYVHGDSMSGAGIHNGDVLIVDKRDKSFHNKIVVAKIWDSFFVKRFFQNNGTVKLHSENSEYQDIEVTEDMGMEIVGVAKRIVKDL